MAEETKLTIGMADITIDGVKVGRQADAMVLTAEPILQEVDLYLAPAYDRIVEGWTVEAVIVVDEETYNHYEMALAGAEVIKDENGEIIGLKDGKGMKSLRKEAKEVLIHPADAGTDTSFDITLFKAVPTGAVERTYGKEVTGYEITLTALHRTGDPSQSGNYFRIGNEESENAGQE